MAHRRTVHVLGVPLDLGGGRRGVDMGPSAVRIAGLGERLTRWASRSWTRAISPRRFPKRRPSATRRNGTSAKSRACARSSISRSYQSHEEGALPIVLGGDHSLAAGSVGASADFAAHKHREIGLLWIDAHGDMNTPETTTSGNVHGMPLAALLGPEPAELSRIGHRSPKVRAEKTVLIGVRNLDDLEKKAIRDAKVHVFTIKDIDKHGIAVVMKRALALAGKDTSGVHVSLDLDVCDPSIAPGVGTPVKGGLDYREAHMAMEMIADSGRLMGLDLVEINPILDSQNQTAVLGTELVLSAMGMRII